MTLCVVDDVKSFMTGVIREAADDATILTHIHAAEAEVYAHITPCYYNSCPFADPVPPILRWDCARLAYGYFISGRVGPSEPNKTDYGETIIRQIKKDLEKIVMCEKGVYNQDGSLVQRDIPCPEGSPNSNASVTDIMVSNTGMEAEEDITIFSLNDNPKR